MIPIEGELAIGEDEVRERFVKASGPGGQHVNKTSTACELRFDVRASPSLPEAVKARLERLAGARLTQEGEIVIFAGRFRSQERNRADARARLVALIARAARPPAPRRRTRPPGASRARRLETKRRRAQLKSTRREPSE